MDYVLTEEDRNFLKTYDINNYKRPSLAIDLVIFLLNEKEKKDIRKIPEQKLSILLLKRQMPPFSNKWALPGGFCHPDEDVVETANRVLYDEAGVSNACLSLTGVYGEKNRDPRGWIISNTYTVLLKNSKINRKNDPNLWKAIIFDVELIEKNKYVEGDKAITLYEMRFSSENECFSVEVKEISSSKFISKHITEVSCNEYFAFDHAKMIFDNLIILRNSVEIDKRIPFELLQEKFTFFELQNAFEQILGKKLIKSNFRRDIERYIVKTEEYVSKAGCRPAILLKRNF